MRRASGRRVEPPPSGHVWQGRFKAFPIQDDEHLLTVLAYVEANPLRARLALVQFAFLDATFPPDVPGRRSRSARPGLAEPDRANPL